MEMSKVKVAAVPGSRVTVNAGNGEIAKLLECPVCYEITTAPIFLCESGHFVCNPCRMQVTDCPSCRGRFTMTRDRFAETFLDLFCLVTCRYSDSGCEAVLKGGEFADHLDKCHFRPITCNICKIQVSFSKFIEHLKTKHLAFPTKAEATVTTARFEVDNDALENDRARVFWQPLWIHAYGHDFFCFLEKKEGNWCLWFGMHGKDEECDRFTCSITLFNRIKQMHHVGKVHPIRSSGEEVLNTEECLVFRDNIVRDALVDDELEVYVKVQLNEAEVVFQEQK